MFATVNLSCITTGTLEECSGNRHDRNSYASEENGVCLVYVSALYFREHRAESDRTLSPQKLKGQQM